MFIRNLFFEFIICHYQQLKHFLKHYRLQDFGYFQGLIFQQLVYLIVWVVGSLTAFTKDEVMKYCHFDSCVVPAAWSDFVSCR